MIDPDSTEPVSDEANPRQNPESDEGTVIRSLRLAQFAIDHALDAVAWIGPDARFLYVNEAACRSLGYSREELLTMTVHDVDPSFGPEVWPDHWQQIKERGSFTFESCHRTKEGHVFPVEVTVNFLEFEGHEYNISVARNISRRKQVEAELRHRIEMLTALHHTALDLAAQRALPDLLPAIVARAVDLLKVKRGGIYLYRPETDDLELGFLHGQSRDWLGVVLQRGEGLAGKVLESGQPISVADYGGWEGRSDQFAGLGSFGAVAVPIRWQGQTLGVLSLADNAPRTFSPADVALLEQFAPLAAVALVNARLLEAEQRQRELAEMLREVAGVLNSCLDRKQVWPLILDQLSRVVTFDNASIMLQVDNRLEMVAQRGLLDKGPWLPSLSIEDLPHIQEVLASRRPVIIPDVQVDPRWVHHPEDALVGCWLGVPLVVKGQALGLLNLGHQRPGFYTGREAQIAQAFADQAALAIANTRLYAELQQRIDELQRTQAQLVQSAKMAAIGELAAGVAHELNNPLTSILGFAELVFRNTKADDPIRGDLQVISDEARRARDIVRGLLDFSQQTNAVREPIDVNKVVQETIALVRQQLKNHHVQLMQGYARDLPPVMLSVNRIKQVFLNLITNALHAMPDGGTLAVTTERAGGEVAIRIADTGVGISAENLPRIFEPFFTTRPVGQGTGLGLAVSLGIVREHGGRITVESEEGVGSRFTVWLPVPNVDGE